MNPSVSKCPHDIKLSKPCPWCDREGFREFVPQRAWQLWQIEFNEIVQILANRGSQGPLAFAVIVEDLNGEVMSSIHGPAERIKVFQTALDERIKVLEQMEEEQAGECLDKE